MTDTARRRSGAGSPGALFFAVGAALLGVCSSPGSGRPVAGRAAVSVQTDTAFRVAVLLSTTRGVDADDFARVFARATAILLKKTGEGMIQTDYVDVGPGRALDVARRYVNAHSQTPPDGVIVLSDDRESREYGAYSASVQLPSGHVNRFPSPFEGERAAYVAVVDFFHLYARCGYDSRLNRVGRASRGGECRGVEGLICVDNGRYWMCPDSTDDLNADRDYFIGSAIVHEFVHPFGMLGDDDHWGTPECTARTGMPPEQVVDRRLFQESLGMCPDLFPKFRHRRP